MHTVNTACLWRQCHYCKPLSKGAYSRRMIVMATALKASPAAHSSSLGVCTIHGASMMVASMRPPLGCPSLSSHKLMLCTLTCMR